MTTTDRRILAPLVLVALLAVGCGGDGDGAAGPTGSTGATSTGATQDDADRYGGGGEPTGATGASASTGSAGATVQANNFSFDPSELEVASGEALTVRNGNANTPHTFTVDGTDLDVELAPLASEEVAVELDPGDYDFACRFHAEMTGTLTVT